MKDIQFFKVRKNLLPFSKYSKPDFIYTERSATWHAYGIQKSVCKVHRFQ